MIPNINLICFIVVFFETINALPPSRRFRRQINFPNNNNRQYDSQSFQVKAPSGSIPGTAYYGIGSDPNYGSYIARPNSAHQDNAPPMSYNPNSNLYGQLINPSHSHQNKLQRQNYPNNNYYGTNNAGQGYNGNNYNNQFYNRYPPGSQGWYATAGNYWFNTGQSLIAHPCLLLITVTMLVFSK